MDPMVVATELRTVLEQFTAKALPMAWAADLTGACSVASSSLIRLLRRRDIPATFVLGEFRAKASYGMHCWARLDDGTYLDVTASQFDDRAWVADPLKRKVFPRVYRTREGDDPRYVVEAVGPRAVAGTREWDEGRSALVTRLVRRTEKALVAI